MVSGVGKEDNRLGKGEVISFVQMYISYNASAYSNMEVLSMIWDGVSWPSDIKKTPFIGHLSCFSFKAGDLINLSQLSSDMRQLQVSVIKLGYIKLGRYAVKKRKKERKQ